MQCLMDHIVLNVEDNEKMIEARFWRFKTHA